MKEDLNRQISGPELQIVHIKSEAEESYEQTEPSVLRISSKFRIVDPQEIIKQKLDPLQPSSPPTLSFQDVSEQTVSDVKVTPPRVQSRRRKSLSKPKKHVAPSEPPVQKKTELSLKSRATITIQYKKAPVRKRKQTPVTAKAAGRGAKLKSRPSAAQNKTKAGARAKGSTVGGRLTVQPKGAARKIRKPSVKKGKLYVCQLCDKTYTVYSSYFHHLSNIHGRNAQPHTCDFCGRTMKNKNTMLHHMRRNHLGPNRGKVFRCSFCSKKFNDRSGLMVHKKRLHKV